MLDLVAAAAAGAGSLFALLVVIARWQRRRAADHPKTKPTRPNGPNSIEPIAENVVALTRREGGSRVYH